MISDEEFEPDVWMGRIATAREFMELWYTTLNDTGILHEIYVKWCVVKSIMKKMGDDPDEVLQEAITSIEEFNMYMGNCKKWDGCNIFLYLLIN